MEQHDLIKRIDSDGFDARWYEGIKIIVDEQGKPKDEQRLWAYPSVTSKLGEVFPKGQYLLQYMRDNGQTGMAEFVKAGEEGTEAHIAIEKLLHGEVVPTLDMPTKVKKCVQAFLDWYNEFKPEVIATEQIVVNHEYKYAGACDFICKLDYTKGKTVYKGIYVIDFKTSSSLHQSHELQDIAYLKALPESLQDKAALLHLGNKTNAGWSFKELEVEENWKLFKHFNETYELLNPNAQPSAVEYPETFVIIELFNNQNNAKKD